MFNLQKDTYVVLNYNGKNKLALVSSTTKSTVNAFLNEDLERDDTVNIIKVPIGMIIADLGMKPKVGSAYGVKVEPFYASEEFESWGTIKYYRLLPGKEKKFLHKALTRTIEVLNKKGLASFVPLDLKIHEHNGKYLGYYKHSKKDGVNSILGLQPPTFELDPEDVDYIIFHEAAHALWFKRVNSELRAAWAKLFEKRVKCKKIKQKELDILLDAIYKHADGGIRDFIKHEATDEEQEVIKSCLSYMKKVYRLSIDDIDDLIKEDNIDDFWPTQQEISRVLPDISEYSMTAVPEMWAEAMAHYLIGNKLPKDVRVLIKETIQVIKI